MTPSFSTTMRVILLSLLVGAGSGVIASALTDTYLSQYALQLSGLSGPIRLAEERPRTKPEALEEALFLVREVAFPSVAEIHLGSGRTLSGVFETNDAVASGVVLTSDGWIMTSANLSLAEAAAAKIVLNRVVYPVQSVVQDAATRVLFLKIGATNLPVLAFGSARDLELGDSLFLIPQRGSLVVSSFVAFPQTASLIARGEEIGRRLVAANSVNASQSGAPVVNTSGELVGIMDAESPAQATVEVIPLDALLPVIDSLLRQGKITRPFLGVTGVDLSRAVGLPVDSSLSRGFTHGVSIQSVSPGSPAALARLLPKDIILEINGSSIGSEWSIDELLVEYAPGDTITLLVDRKGDQQKIDMTLSAF